MGVAAAGVGGGGFNCLFGLANCGGVGERGVEEGGRGKGEGNGEGERERDGEKDGEKDRDVGKLDMVELEVGWVSGLVFRLYEYPRH